MTGPMTDFAVLVIGLLISMPIIFAAILITGYIENKKKGGDEDGRENEET